MKPNASFNRSVPAETPPPPPPQRGSLKTFFSAMTRKRCYRIHTTLPPNPQTNIPPGGMHVVVVGGAQAPPPWDPPPAAEHPPYTLQPTPPKLPPQPPPPKVLTDSWGGVSHQDRL